MTKFTTPKKGLMASMLFAALMLSGCEKELDNADLAASSVNAAKAAETAQSIMVDLEVNAPVIEGTESWKFDSDAAAAYFTGGTAQNRNAAAQAQKCTFYDGGTLESKKFGQVTVYPVSSEALPARTAWVLESSEAGTTSDVTLDIRVAGQSVVVNKGKAKYSFSLLDAEGLPRISNLKVSVTGQEDVIDPAFMVEVGDETNNCLADVFYAANAGDFGSATSSLLNNMTMGEIIGMNEYSSVSACGNASIAKVDRLNYSLPAGTYTITVTGTVKGNAGMAATPFEVTRSVVVGTCN
ncbi:MAG: hypothetical protein LPK03_06825 [Pontibacter sp.]|nr:hypothetical protein [Pontibacter sp.]